MNLSDAIVKRLNELMKEHSFSQYDFFTKGGMPKSTVSQVLNGNRKNRIAISTIFEMVSTMGVTLKDFFDSPIFEQVTD